MKSPNFNVRQQFPFSLNVLQAEGNGAGSVKPNAGKGERDDGLLWGTI